MRFVAAAAAAIVLSLAPAFAEDVAPAVKSVSPAENETVAAGDVPFVLALEAEGKLTELVVTKPDGSKLTLVDWAGDAAVGSEFTYPMPGLTPGDYAVSYTVNHITAPAGRTSQYIFKVN